MFHSVTQTGSSHDRLHGDVVSSFIARKYDRAGKRFGFFSFSNRNDADRAAFRLNGLWILGYRLTVKEARYRDKSQSRKLYSPSDSKVVSSVEQEKNNISGASTEEKVMRSSKIVQGEAYENDEVFLDIQHWIESYRPSQRVTWIKLFGVPLHCWNHITFKRIIEQWGEFLAMRENALQDMGCDEVRVLIATDRKKSIDDVLDLELGRDLFKGEDVGERNTGEEAIMGLRTNDDGSGNVQKRINDEIENVEGVEVTARRVMEDIMCMGLKITSAKNINKMEEDQVDGMLADQIKGKPKIGKEWEEMDQRLNDPKYLSEDFISNKSRQNTRAKVGKNKRYVSLQCIQDSFANIPRKSRNRRAKKNKKKIECEED
ncbi:hypothetical protein F3Y22_tig00112383pilonHSYRG00562 [Hibiscus syriacus]|uniref:RRM domain-containing protein n=1 Tax=Hibiscus syriacus TaxID=106335 RepID=A0A6A2YAL7_HIBSY|nr:hypothetical protein F3Y22_tig00112383pilonHSYRG00562 [Hibiscus syriacus]